jgi:maleylpyruvate isomerase
VPEEGWLVPMQVMNFSEFPASELLTRRLVELELHHADLGAGYGPADWPASLATLDLPEPMKSQRRDRITGTLET